MKTPAPSKPSKRGRAAGFSLIEVVVAMALFALAATVLTNSFVNTLLARQRAQSGEGREADLRAVRLQLLLEPDREAAEEGSEYETLAGGRAVWRAEIEPTDIVDLFEVRLAVEFTEAADEAERDHGERLFLLRPTWAEGAERSELLDEKRRALQDERDFGRF
jgi:general secretion pathway protein I